MSDREKIELYETQILAAADSLVQDNPEEAYYQLYKAVDPTFSLREEAFPTLRARLIKREK